jgi:outer membrane lipoprotein-sorting protein
MRFLRTVSTRRLLALIAGFVSAIAAGAAIAVAAAGTGPVPVHKPLAQAVHDALAAPKINGISARISFTNHLIDSTDIQGSDPILSGASGRLWLSNDHGLRLELQSNNGDAQVVVNNRSFWVYDPSSNTVYKGKLPADAAAAHKTTKTAPDRVASIAQIQTDIAKLAQHANLSGAIPSDVAGRAAYTVRVSPKHDGGLLGAGALAWDALKGVPLRLAVYARNDPTPVLQLKATDVSFGHVSASVFKISPPRGAKVVKVDTTSTSTGTATAAARKAKAHGRQKEVSGAAAVAKRLPFTLVAPRKLVGLPRRSVTLLSWGGTPAALVAYGQNLGGVAVIEQPAKSATTGAQSAAQSGRPQGLNLPTVSIKGATGQELDTALGTMVRFTRGGVSYTVVGSVPAAAADAAARAL